MDNTKYLQAVQVTINNLASDVDISNIQKFIF